MHIERYDIRTSSRRVFRRCLRKWGFQSSLRRGLKRKGAESNINFWFGSAIHFAMEDYFGWNKFGDPRRAFKAYYEAFKPDERPEGADVHYDLGLAMLTYFLEWYPKHNSDIQIHTIWFDENDQPVAPNTPGARPGVEEEFLFDLGYRAMVDAQTGEFIKTFEEDDLCYLTELPRFNEDDEITYEYSDPNGKNKLVHIVPVCYHGTMDRIVEDRFGRWWILDYKTAKGADTRKLDTDDQISSYMWAAEQKYQRPFYGFIYLQLTKDVAQPPRRLKDGKLSVDKKQKTTYQLYKEEVVRDYGLINKAPNAIIEMLNHLAEIEEPEGDRFIRWDYVTRNESQKIATYYNIMAETKMMLDPSLFLFPNPTRDCGWDCPFREMCIAMDKGEDVEYLLSLEFDRREDALEHNEDAWRENLKWPESPLEAAALDDKNLRPENIFNIILPDKYYSDSYEED